MFNNSICPGCNNRYNCPASNDDIICDDITGYVVECDCFDGYVNSDFFNKR